MKEIIIITGEDCPLCGEAKDLLNSLHLNGLSLIKGKIKKFKFNTNKLPIPHMGWNNIDLKKKSRLFSDQTEKNRFYFAHSYYALCQNTKDELSSTNYSFEFTSFLNNSTINK